MRFNIKIYPLLLGMILILGSCTHSHNGEHDHGNETPQTSTHEENSHKETAHLSTQQFKALGMKVDTLPKRNISSYVESNGRLEVPPQNEATVTAIIGANVVSIEVIEGDEVSKNQVLAYMSHPDLINLQTDYIQSWNKLQYLEKEFQRQKKLYDENVGAGKEFQQAQSEYQSAKGMVKGYEAQVKLLGLDLKRINESHIYERIPVKSPISGSIRFVNVKTGQYASPQTELFDIVNIDHVHADLMVFEKDMHKVAIGQKVKFTLESPPKRELEATIYSVGKSFEENPKAIHIHAEIENKEGYLIPGMYVRGRILTGNEMSDAVPNEALIREGDKYYIFDATKVTSEQENEWVFTPIEVITGAKDNGWTAIKLLHPLPENSQIAWNNAYYLIAEMKKSEGGHHH